MGKRRREKQQGQHVSSAPQEESLRVALELARVAIAQAVAFSEFADRFERQARLGIPAAREDREHLERARAELTYMQQRFAGLAAVTQGQG
jgi:hypothetical protein